jgi:hypothetical protein
MLVGTRVEFGWQGLLSFVFRNGFEISIGVFKLSSGDF